MPEIGKHPDWIFLTHDGRQRYIADERDAIMRSGVAHIIHVGKLRHDEMAKSFVLAAPKILRFREKNTPPFIAKLYRPERKNDYRVVAGSLSMILAQEEWLKNGATFPTKRDSGGPGPVIDR